MQKQWESRILSIDKIKEIKPNLDALKIINSKLSEKAEIIFFDIKWKVYTQIVINCIAKELLPIIKWKVGITSIINSDWWKTYDWLVDLGY